MNFGTIKRICVTFCVNHILSGTHSFRLKRRLLNSIGYEIGENTKVVGPVFCTGKLKIGCDCWVGRELYVEGNGTVEIGDRCDIAPGVMFVTGGHKIGTQDRRAGNGEHYSISVGDGSWIGARATVVRQTRIGSGCVIAACACVSSDVPENTLVGGVPAKPIRELVS